jgi:hypothetical protein
VASSLDSAHPWQRFVQGVIVLDSSGERTRVTPFAAGQRGERCGRPAHYGPKISQNSLLTFALLDLDWRKPHQK